MRQKLILFLNRQFSFATMMFTLALVIKTVQSVQFHNYGVKSGFKNDSFRE